MQAVSSIFSIGGIEIEAGISFHKKPTKSLICIKAGFFAAL